MSDTLSDEELELLARNVNLHSSRGVNPDHMELAALELRRWRAAFAWLESKDGGIYSDQKFQTKPWNAMSCGSCCAGATALEAIEALRAKVKP